ncbi:M55 family metallopeptidase [Bacillus sp. 179-C3.3 HS]|uniref:M55 family metallopeptidase n=1 Tax=Bacillus sp. 179-C3.3 HS TaxID=3232162 RepID=UPI0039A1E6FB
MNLYVSVDMEGITGLADHTFVDARQHNYERGRKIMTAEVNACVVALLQNGATNILVNDSHSKMNNVLIEELHEEATLISGDVKPYSMVQGLDETIDAAVFLGYHARASMKGVMSHSMIFGVRQFYINDHPIGEMGFNAYVAGYFGVPVILVCGDDQAALEAEQLMPGVKTVAVKETISRSAVKCLPPAKVNKRISQQVKAAMNELHQMKPLTPPEQPLLKIEFANYGQAEWANLMPGTSMIEGTTTVTYQADNILEAYQAMLVMTELAARTTFC